MISSTLRAEEHHSKNIIPTAPRRQFFNQSFQKA